MCGSIFLWWVLFPFQFAVGPHLLSYYSFMLFVPFLWLMFFIRTQVARRRKFICFVLCFFLLTIFLRNFDKGFSTEWGTYPKEVNMLNAARFAWNISNGYNDRKFRFPKGLDYVSFAPEVYNEMVEESVNWSKERFAKVILPSIILGVRMPGKVKGHKDSKYDVIIMDTSAKNMEFNINLISEKDETKNFKILIKNGSNGSFEKNNIIGNLRRCTRLEHLLDSSRKGCVNWSALSK